MQLFLRLALLNFVTLLLDGADGFSLSGRGSLSRSATWTRVNGQATDRVESRTVEPIKKMAGTIQLPGSKSLSNRALLLAALSEGETIVENLLDSDDISYMLKVKRYRSHSCLYEANLGCDISAILGFIAVVVESLYCGVEARILLRLYLPN